MSHSAVIGAGAWGTSLSIVLGRKGTHKVRLWAHEKEVRSSIAASHVNELFLPGLLIPEGVSATDSLQDALRCCLDYLLSRDDIHQSRIALLGDGLGSADATRAAATDSRWSAVVCDGGFWEDIQLQYAKQTLRGAGADVGAHDRFALGERIKCPCLVLVGEDDYAEVKGFVGLYEHCKARGVPIELKIFSGDETGAAHRQLDNPTIGRHFIFDWLKGRLFINEPNVYPDKPTFGLVKEIVADLEIVSRSRPTSTSR